QSPLPDDPRPPQRAWHVVGADKPRSPTWFRWKAEWTTAPAVSVFAEEPSGNDGQELCRAACHEGARVGCGNEARHFPSDLLGPSLPCGRTFRAVAGIFAWSAVTSGRSSGRCLRKKSRYCTFMGGPT